MKRLLFIYNPNAGRQKAKSNLSTILDIFSAAGYLTTVCPTRGRGDATDNAALSAGYDRIVCCGGDGTLNETVTGLMNIPPRLRPVLGYIPTGTTNDFARNLSLPRGMDKMASVACQGIPRLCDLGRAGNHWFTYVAAFGLFTDVSYATPQNAKNMLGHMAYVLEGASRLSSIKSYTMNVEAESISITDEFIYGMVGNTVSVGGLVNLPSDKVKLDDGLFEVLLIRKPKHAADYQSIFHALSTQTLPENGPLLGFPASKVTFNCDEPLPWTLDGEFGGEQSTFTIENHHQAFMLACGK